VFTGSKFQIDAICTTAWANRDWRYVPNYFAYMNSQTFAKYVHHAVSVFSFTPCKFQFSVSSRNAVFQILLSVYMQPKLIDVNNIKLNANMETEYDSAIHWWFLNTIPTDLQLIPTGRVLFKFGAVREIVVLLVVLPTKWKFSELPFDSRKLVNPPGGYILKK